MSKTLVAFFSASGVTKKAAQVLAEAIGADLYEIKPAVSYTRADLDWQDRNSRSTMEMRDASSRPQLADGDANIAAYERVFLGFPIWWYTAPAIIRTFLERYDFGGKTIVLFATSGGSGMGKTVEDLRPSCPGAILKEGKLLNGPLASDALKKWAEGF